MIDQIRDWLYISGYRSAREGAYLREKGITAQLSLIDDIPKHEGITQLLLPIDDGVPVRQEKIAQGVTFLKEQRAAGKTILVNCGAGISRSTLFCMAILMEDEGLSLREAYEAVLEKHPEALPHMKLGVCLAQYHGIRMSEMAWVTDVLREA
ncbi:MAG: dual specificity protein phosphatase [Chloroflexota bacterium]